MTERASGLIFADALESPAMTVRQPFAVRTTMQHAAARLRELEAIVDKLPKTVDGAPVVPQADSVLETLQALYDSEINVSLSWCWDGGVDAKVYGGCTEKVAWGCEA